MYLISYDIASTKIRTKLAKKLLNYGKRIQYSVFECNMDKSRFQKCYREMVELTDGKANVSIRCYFIDKTSQEQIVTIGDPEYIGFDEIDDILFI